MAVVGGGGGMVAGGGGVAGGGVVAGGGGGAAGCAGACGGAEAMCIQPEGTVSSVQWRFVGCGRGGYEQQQSYSYVGQGCGSYVAEEVAIPYGWKVRPICCVLLVVAIVIVLIVLLMPGSETTTTTTTVTVTNVLPFNCLTMDNTETWSP